MRNRLFFALFALIVVSLRLEAQCSTVVASPGDTIIVVCSKTETVKDSDQVQMNCCCKDSNRTNNSPLQSNDLNALTVAVNTVNNVLDDMNTLFTVVAVIISIVTILVAVIGLFGIHDIRKDVEEYKEKLSTLKETINEKIDLWQKEEKILKEKNEKIERVQTLNNQYLQKINQWMLNNTYSIADTPGENTVQGRDLMAKSILNYYLMKLYLSNDKHEIDGCINYIKNKGGENEIEHLQFIVDNDPDKYKCDKTSMAIGYIKGRMSSMS